MYIFLSHSSSDKPFVRKIKKALISQGHKTWIDEEDIPIGESIAKAIGTSLERCNVVIVFLSKESVKSNWVNEEWRNKFFDQVNKGQVFILPLLIEKCEIPPLLRDKKYADFTKDGSYESSLSLLLNRLKEIQLDISGTFSKPFNKDSSIFEHTKEFLNELEEEMITLPIYGNIPIITNLKKIKRTGKLVRLESFVNKPKIKIRSIYDHILSVAHFADCLLPIVNSGITVEKHTELARIIAFHELNETVLGDIPSYTNLREKNRTSTSNPAEQTLRLVNPKTRENIANKFIWMFLSGKRKKSLEAVLHYLSQTESNMIIFFKILDKIDPIISIWRYLKHYKGKIGNIDEFLSRLRDFFEYPDVKKFVNNSQFNEQLSPFIGVLQNRHYAKQYYKDSDFIGSHPDLFTLPSDVIRRIIEDCPLFIEENATAPVSAIPITPPRNKQYC
jgi:5'-deoxynucleotidase YfbR-like HD superfamily hydrolase